MEVSSAHMKKKAASSPVGRKGCGRKKEKEGSPDSLIKWKGA